MHENCIDRHIGAGPDRSPEVRLRQKGDVFDTGADQGYVRALSLELAHAAKQRRPIGTLSVSTSCGFCAREIDGAPAAGSDVEQQQRVVAEGARPEGARERKVNAIPDPPPFPFVAPQRLRATITIGNSMRFEPAAITVRAGQPVELTLHNDGQFPHDFTLSEGVTQPVKIIVNGGQTASGTFTLDHTGTYNFQCSMPAHALAGMTGTITAQ